MRTEKGQGLVEYALISVLVIIVGIVIFALVFQPTEVTQPDSIPRFIERFIDDEAGVVCWRYKNNGGISCLPISDTKLRVGE